MIEIRCDNCDATIQVDNPIVGQKVKCPKCGDVNVLRAAQPVGGGSVKPDRAAAAGYPPAFGPEADVMSIRPAMMRASPGRFFGLVLLLLGGVIGGTVLLATGVGTPLAFVAFAIGIIAGMVLLLWRLQTMGDGLKITTKRTIDRRGIFSRKTSEVLHADIRNIQIEQTFWERIWGVGTLAISCAAENEDEVEMADVPNPEKVRNVIDLYRPV